MRFEPVAINSPLAHLVITIPLLVATIFFWDQLAGDITRSAVYATIIGAGCTLIACRSSAQWLNAGSAFSGLLFLFHAGLLVLLGFHVPFQPLNQIDTLWIYSSDTSNAALLYAFGHLSFTIGLALWHIRGNFSSSTPPAAIPAQDPTTQDSSRLNVVGKIGLALFFFGLIGWGFSVMSSGASVFGGSYTQFLTATTSAWMPYTYFAISFGFGMSATLTRRVARRNTLIIFLLWAAPAFMLGLRGEVIIPVLVYGVIHARLRGLSLNPLWILLFPIALMLGSVVRSTRVAGFSFDGVTWQSLNPMASIAELGYTIRPLTYIWSWHEDSGEPHVGIGTYLNPFTRLVFSTTFDGSTIDIRSDPTRFIWVMADRIGPVGGSPIAEAYRSGGFMTVFIVMALIGIACAAIDRSRDTPGRIAAKAMILYVLLLWVRNDFSPTAVALLLIVLMIIVVHFGSALHLTLRRRRGHFFARRPPRVFERSPAEPRSTLAHEKLVGRR